MVVGIIIWLRVIVNCCECMGRGLGSGGGGGGFWVVVKNVSY